MGDSNLLFESVFKRKLSDADTREYLTQITTEHPYFTPAQYYLLLLSREGTSEFELQAGKTSILFNNPWWLQFQFQNSQQDPESQIIVPGEIVEAQPLEDTTPVQSIQPVETTVIEPEIAQIQAEKEFPLTVEETELLQPENFTTPIIEENTIFPPSTNEVVSENENFVEETVAAVEMEPDLSQPPTNPADIEEMAISATPAEIPGSTVLENKDEIIDNLNPGHFNRDSQPLENESDTEEYSNNEQELAPLNFKLNIDAGNPTEDTITFEPLHTTDYFASLGIKLSGDVQPTDKLGKQLKSFTEWLKTMKKIHQEEPQAQSVASDISIQNLAEKSNKEDEVLTEAMAEVLLQQGKSKKAIEVFKKLSLLNPSKSAYFAAKIDQLKEH